MDLILLCESVLVQKMLAEPESAVRGFLGDEPVRTSNGRDGEASQRYFAGRRVGLREVRASTLWVKHAVEPPGSISRREGCGYALRLLGCVALSCAENGDSFRPDEVPRRLCSDLE